MNKTTCLPAAATAALILALSACSSVPPVVPAAAVVPDAQARAAEQQRVQAIGAQPQWGFAGRVAVSNGRDGGNGRLDWQQDAQGFQARLSAPVTRQGWELSVDAATGQARLDGLAGGPQHGADARALVLAATGWDLPVAGLGDWVRGLVGESAAALEHDAQGRPLRARQDGWEVQFSQWHDASGSQPSLPRRIDVVNGAARVRLLVDQWSGWEQ